MKGFWRHLLLLLASVPPSQALFWKADSQYLHPRDIMVHSGLQVRGGRVVPSGWNPFGYKITVTGMEFLKYDGSLESDVGRFLASLKARRTLTRTLKASWLEIVRASKAGQNMRIYRQLDELVAFCLKVGFID